MAVTILGIESSCDDTSAAIVRDTLLLSNVMASQDVHKAYGGVVPELASRAHQQNIVPVVARALQLANVRKEEIDAIAFTRGPGLLGSLLVGTSFAKGLALALDRPLIEVNHLTGHVLSHFVRLPQGGPSPPDFPFLCLLVSGGHTQILQVHSPLHYAVLGQTIDDAVGEAFDKGAKIMGLEYPGGPIIDKYAQEGDAKAFRFAKPRIAGLDYSFSGIKTSLLYFLRDRLSDDPDFITQHLADLCACWQSHLIDILLDKLIKAAAQTRIRRVALAGGVSANSGLRARMQAEAAQRGWELFLPPIRFTTDNAAMIAVAGFYKYKEGLISTLEVAPLSRAREFA
ncbi:MAG: tRNA (adenosine(37)-N6)-threonylcarbamoyltransferase complex transferase subunit TsaD [Bacteroidetes bacterium]|nr:tRNA (adenosine(37)-N6)-threonylcarbamoyltransferase complex transferase subunit TsaD [Bacteroidota bacterium]